MVSAVILLTVSTLVAHAVATPTKQLGIQHACKGQTLCDVKPDNYPQELIDHLVKQNLHHLHRTKREFNMPDDVPFYDTDDNKNNCESERTTGPFYTIEKTEGMTEAIVQSNIFSQTLTQVYCRDERSSCFEDLPKNDITFACTTVPTKVTVWVLRDGELANSTVEISTGCMCAK